MGYGSQILMERRRKGVRQKKLAAVMGININTLVDIERERIPVNTEMLSLALKALESFPDANTQTTTVA